MAEDRRVPLRRVELEPLQTELKIPPDFQGRPPRSSAARLTASSFFLPDEPLGEEDECQAGDEDGHEKKEDLLAMPHFPLADRPRGGWRAPLSPSPAPECHENVMTTAIRKF